MSDAFVAIRVRAVLRDAGAACLAALTGGLVTAIDRLDIVRNAQQRQSAA